MSSQNKIQLTVFKPDSTYEEIIEPNDMTELLHKIPHGCRGYVLEMPISHNLLVAFEIEDTQRPGDPRCLYPHGATILLPEGGRVAVSTADNDSFIASVRAAMQMSETIENGVTPLNLYDSYK